MSTKPTLTRADFERAAQKLGCEPEVVLAIAEVETGWKPGKSGFQVQSDGHLAPIILFEPHIFSRLTDRRYDQSHPDLSRRTWSRSVYGSTLSQHPKLARAAALDRDAALQSCSWGVFQVMGFNWKTCGYATLQGFINAMYRSEEDHLAAFVGFCVGTGLAPAMRSKDWARIARGYNGPGYSQNSYDKKMAAAYARHKGAK